MPLGPPYHGQDSANGDSTPPTALKSFLAQVSTSDHGDTIWTYTWLKSGSEGADESAPTYVKMWAQWEASRLYLS